MTTPLLTELAEELAADSTGSKRKELVEKIDLYLAESQQFLRQGVSAEHFPRLTALSEALTFARAISEKIVFPT